MAGAVLCLFLWPLHLHAQHEPSVPAESAVGATVASSIRLATMQHLLRIGTQQKTRAELGGPFFRDYVRSVRWPAQWTDGDSLATNYVGHPMQGAASGFIWLAHRPAAPSQFEMTRTYWTSRLKSAGWAAGYSAQFEIGPLSEASIGNVGLKPETVGWVDHVITPSGGVAVVVGEDLIDRFVVARLESRMSSATGRRLLRMILNPSRSIANVADKQAPWHRTGRPLRPTP
jgi:hypothetical protein